MEPILGVNFTKNIGFSNLENELIYNDVIPDENFSKSSVSIGFGITQNFTEKFSLSLLSSLSNHNMQYSDTGIIGYQNVKFKRLSFYVFPSWSLMKNIELGFGVNFQKLLDFEIGIKNRNLWYSLGEEYRQNQIGWVSSISYHLKSFCLSFRYLHAKSKVKSNVEYVKSTDSIELSLSYRFKFIK